MLSVFLFYFLDDMRLDLFLKVSRLILRRTLAQEFCDAGRVKINGMTAKPAREVKVGDEIEITRLSKVGDEIEITRLSKVLTVNVLQVPVAKQVSRQASSGLFEIVSETIISDSDSEFGVEFGESKIKPST